jgi:thioredoxin-related protein
MKKLLSLLFFAAMVSAHAEAQWLTSMPDALKKAQSEDKAVLVDFTGSDWCGWCIKLKSEVFDKPEFAAFAKENLVLLEIDFPQRKPQSSALRQANQKLQQEFRVQGYPTIFILDKAGKRLHQTGYLPGGPKNYISQLTKIHGVNWRPSSGQTISAEAKNSSKAAATKGDVSPLQLPPTPRYDELILKGITGTADKRIVLINNQTFSAGESAKVKLGDKQVKIVCKEIRDDSVLVQIEGKSDPIELKLGAKK